MAAPSTADSADGRTGSAHVSGPHSDNHQDLRCVRVAGRPCLPRASRLGPHQGRCPAKPGTGRTPWRPPGYPPDRTATVHTPTTTFVARTASRADAPTVTARGPTAVRHLPSAVDQYCNW